MTPALSRRSGLVRDKAERDNDTFHFGTYRALYHAKGHFIYKRRLRSRIFFGFLVPGVDIGEEE